MLTALLSSLIFWCFFTIFSGYLWILNNSFNFFSIFWMILRMILWMILWMIFWFLFIIFFSIIFFNFIFFNRLFRLFGRFINFIWFIGFILYFFGLIVFGVFINFILILFFDLLLLLTWFWLLLLLRLWLRIGWDFLFNIWLFRWFRCYTMLKKKKKNFWIFMKYLELQAIKISQQLLTNST